jgi:hypothetical protein
MIDLGKLLLACEENESDHTALSRPSGYDWQLTDARALERLRNAVQACTGAQELARLIGLIREMHDFLMAHHAGKDSRGAGPGFDLACQALCVLTIYE